MTRVEPLTAPRLRHVSRLARAIGENLAITRPTSIRSAREQITPDAIAAGRGDAYILSLDEAIERSGQPVYIRLFPEMDQANNAYCAFNPDGAYRGAAHSSAPEWER